MPRCPQRIEKRNVYIKQRFKYHKTKNPKWNIYFIIEAVADDVFLSPAMVTKILKNKGEENIPDATTIIRHQAFFNA